MSRPVRSDFEVLDELVAVRDRDVLDVGCGDGSLVRRLADEGARARGVEVSEAAVRGARAADPTHAERYLVGTAGRIPLPEAALDVALLMRSLHHVPASLMDAAFAELRRVVRADGVVYVAEPPAVGAYFSLVALVDDETEVRALAQAAVARALRSGEFARVGAVVEYDVAVGGGFDAFRTRVVAADPARAERFDAVAERLRAEFDALGPEPLRSPVRVDVLRRLEC